MPKSYPFELCLFIIVLLNIISGYPSQARNESSDAVSFYQVFMPIYRVGEVTNKSCAQDADPDELPQDLFTEDQLAHGAVVLHLFAAVYFFTLLAVVCNDYFLPSVECICVDLNLPKDVAAATFMATATTMPEFFTNTISTLITNSDMGLGTIIGSLMFNTLGVAALSGMALSKSMQLDWWPVTRDCIFYSFNTVVLIIVAWGGTITFTETLVMVILCITYYIVMFLNNKFVKTIRIFVEDKMNCCMTSRYDLTSPPEESAKAKLPIEKKDVEQNGVYTITPNEFSSTVQISFTPKFLGDDDNTKSIKSLFRMPEGSLTKKFWFYYSWPIKAVLTCLVPSPKSCRKFYPLTFIMCIILIGLNAYMIVWMLTVFGNTIKVPDIVMGLTFLAAGATMPEALSSLISVRKGESGIGVSNALGANSLAILLSLGVPWFIKNCMNYYKEDGENIIRINSQGIEYTMGILLVSTLSLFIIMAFAGFRLRRRVGFILIFTYAIYITLQILIEMNIFFPPRTDC